MKNMNDSAEATRILRRVAAMPCICHPMHRKEGDECLGDQARKYLDIKPFEHQYEEKLKGGGGWEAERST